MLRSIAELAAYGTLAALLAAASLAPEAGNAVGSATIGTEAAAEVSSRGSLLFATKGCVGCHTHTALPSSRMSVGPDLSALAERAATRVPGLDARAYVRQSLQDPRAFLVSGYDARMPDLHLSDEEVDTLTAFLLASDR